MLGLLGIGLALTFGVGMRLAAITGALLYVLMWTVVLPPENNPVIDDHLLGAITLVVFAALAGEHLGPREGLVEDRVREVPPRPAVVLATAGTIGPGRLRVRGWCRPHPTHLGG